MHVERLQRMAKLLRDDAANPTGVQFDLGTWGSAAEIAVPEMDRWRELAADRKVPVSCGTQACAFGLAAISGAFAAEGLGYRVSMGGFNIIPTLRDDYDVVHTQFDAAARLFDITMGDASYFFDPDYYEETPKKAEGEIEVAERIEAFIKGVIDRDFHPAFRKDDDDD